MNIHRMWQNPKHQKKLIGLPFAIILALFSGQLLVDAQTHSFVAAWDDPNTADDQVVEYRLYEKIGPTGTYSVVQIIPVPDQTADVEVTVKTGLHYFVVTAVNSIGLESEYSNVLKIQTNNPKKLIIRAE